MSELDEVANLLKEKTAQGKLDWRVEGETRITTMQGKNIIEIVKMRPSGYSLSIRNMDGIQLAQEDFTRFVEPTYDALDRVFQTARRVSLGVDKAISDVKERLLQL